MYRCITIILFLLFTTGINAQVPVRVQLRIIDTSTQNGVPAVSISEKGKSIALTDSSGQAILHLLPGTHLLSFTSVGYTDETRRIGVSDSILSLEIYMVAEEKALENVVVIASTRTNQRIENAPLKVEVLGREEMDEENAIKPASIASILGDVSGVQIQQSSAVSGNANVRIQGLEGKYTQLLRDGMPLYDGFSGGFGVLSIAPLNVKQVELIKGSASTLYGGGAIGGLVNIISRRPTGKQDLSFTLNHSTLAESNVNAYIARRYKGIGYNFYGGYTHQKAIDVNNDGFSDVTGLDAIVLHPALFFYPDNNTTILTGYTLTTEARDGGDMLVLDGKGSAEHPYFEKNKTTRHSGEIMLERKMKYDQRLDIKLAISSFDKKTTTNTHYFNGNQVNYFTEASYFIPCKKNSLVAGINVSGDKFKKKESDPIALNDFSNSTVGAFVQNTWQFRENSSLEAGLRDDYHDRYGNFLLPRLAFFNRFNQHWAMRLGVGLGYLTPNALAPQVIDYPIEALQPIGPDVKAEHSEGYNAEINYKKEWENGNEFFINHAFFLTHIGKPVIATEQPNGDVVFSNASKSIVTKGFDTYVQATVSDFEIYLGYTYTIAERNYLEQNQFMPLTPRNRMAFTIVREFAKVWRIGLEGSYNGPQYRYDATKTPGYFFMAALIDTKIGKHIRIALNGENLLDFRQSKKEALYTGPVNDPTFQPLWAPIDGRVINLAIVFKL